jgi:hypothetical protein
MIDVLRNDVRWFEVAAVFVTAAGFHVTRALDAETWFIASAILGWLAYAGILAWRCDGAARGWGFRADGLGRAFAGVSLVMLPFLAGLAALGAALGGLRWSPHLLWILLLYPAWGIVQQFLVQAMVVSNLTRVRALAKPLPLALVGGVLFSAVHVPSLPLMGATFALGCAFVPLYLRWRNLWPLGLWHGWLGALFYYWVLMRDPWAEMLKQVGG